MAEDNDWIMLTDTPIPTSASRHVKQTDEDVGGDWVHVNTGDQADHQDVSVSAGASRGVTVVCSDQDVTDTYSPTPPLSPSTIQGNHDATDFLRTPESKSDHRSGVQAKNVGDHFTVDLCVLCVALCLAIRGTSITMAMMLTDAPAKDSVSHNVSYERRPCRPNPSSLREDVPSEGDNASRIIMPHVQMPSVPSTNDTAVPKTIPTPLPEASQPALIAHVPWDVYEGRGHLSIPLDEMWLADAVLAHKARMTLCERAGTLLPTPSNHALSVRGSTGLAHYPHVVV